MGPTWVLSVRAGPHVVPINLAIRVSCNIAHLFSVPQHYDAFVSYSHADAHWVWQELLPFLENQEPYFRLCIHDRDFMAGAAVADNISAAVNISRRTIIVLSQSFLNSHWCFEEFRQAHYKVTLTNEHFQTWLLIDWQPDSSNSGDLNENPC